MKRSNVSKWIVFLKNLPLRVILILISIMVGYPLIWSITMSLKTNREILTNPWKLPNGIAFENYVNAFTKSKMSEYFLNSILVTVLSTALLLVFAIPAAYVLCRYKSKILRIILNCFMGCVFIQGTYLMIPLFLQMNQFKMIDNRFWISLVYAVTQFPFSIFLATGFIGAIPKEYEEAAAIDGCTKFRTMVNVMLPMAKSGIVTVAMLSAMGFWNEYPLALIFLTSNEKKTLPIGLANLFEVQKYATDWGALFAGLVIVLIPTVIIYLLGYKRLTSGLSVGGIKG